MHKKMFVALIALALLASVNGYAQKRQLARRMMQSLTGTAPNRCAKETSVMMRAMKLSGLRVSAAQVMMADATFVSSAELFSSVKATQVFSEVPAKELQLLEDKFAQLDAVVLEQPRAGYIGALWQLPPASSPAMLADAQVYAMTDVLEVQQYMKANDGQFPRVYSTREGGWLITTDCLNTPEGNRAFLGVVSILVKEQAGEVSQAVVDQLVTLHAAATNPVAMRDVVNQLKAWQESSPSHSAPQLPSSLEGISLRANAESLWLATEIRLLQLTPGLELPEILKTAQVTQ